VTPATTVDVYAIDPVVSRFTVKAFATGLLSSFGHNPTLAVRDFTGEATLSPAALDQASLVIRIKAGSLTVTDSMSDKDRRELESAMNEEVLETAKYPEIVYEASKVSASQAGEGQFLVNMVGTLGLHGVTNSQAVTARISLMGDMLRANGEFTTLQSAYGIRPVSIAGGSLKLKDELKCSFDIVARKKGPQ
jgi:polyisoprenoid-binding protein YceI